MDTATRDEVAAAAAAHRELGADYGDAVAEGLVERIGAELDKRIDARLSQRGQAGLSALCVPKTSSTSCDQVIFVDQATSASLFSNTVLAEVDWLG